MHHWKYEYRLVDYAKSSVYCKFWNCQLWHYHSKASGLGPCDHNQCRSKLFTKVSDEWDHQLEKQTTTKHQERKRFFFTSSTIIQGQVLNKTCRRPYGTTGGSFFCFDIMDDTGMLRAKAFDDQCNRIFPLVIDSAVSSFSRTRAALQELASRVPL